MYGTSSTTDVWDRGENTAFIPCMQAEHEWIWGVNRMCAMCNCGSVQRYNSDDTNSILPEKSTFNITFSSLLGNYQFSPPLGFFLLFLKTETILATPKSEWKIIPACSKATSADTGLEVFSKSWSEVTLKTVQQALPQQWSKETHPPPLPHGDVAPTQLRPCP